MMDQKRKGKMEQNHLEFVIMYMRNLFIPLSALLVCSLIIFTVSSCTLETNPGVNDLETKNPAPSKPATITAPMETTELQMENSQPVIILNRSGGFAGVDETWQIYSDGIVLFQEEKIKQLESAEVINLQTEISNTGIDELDAEYIPEDPCCDRFEYNLEFTNADGESYTIRAIGGDDQVPDLFWQTLELIHQTLNGSQG